MPADPQLLEEIGIIDVGDEPIFDMSRRRIRELFSFKNGKLNVPQLVLNLIWQDHALITSGDVPPVVGNLRTYWYTRAKPMLTRARASKLEERDETLSDKFTELVLDHQLISYADFGFVDTEAHLRRIDGANRHILLLAEKRGHIALVERLAGIFDCSTHITRGMPSALASSHLLGELRRLDLGDAHFKLVSLVDYDPSGDSIVNAFISQMERLGFTGSFERLDIVRPERLSDEQIRLNKFRIKDNKRREAINDAWLIKTGALEARGHRGLWGLEVESMTWEQVELAFEELVGDEMTIDRRGIARKQLEARLAETLRALALHRFLNRRRRRP